MTTNISKFIKNSGFNLVATIANKASKSLLFILISHTLGVTPMGQLSLALTYLGFGILFSNWGFGNLLIRDVTRDHSKTNKYLSNFAVTRIIFVVITILVLNRIPILLNYSEQTIEVIKIISFSLISTTLVNLCYSALVAFETLKGISVVYIVTSIFRLLFSALAIFLDGNIIQIAYIYLGIEFIVLIFSLFALFKQLDGFKFSIDLKFIWDQTTKAFPFLWIGMLMMLDNRAETVIISSFFNEDYVGYYSASNTILGVITVFSEAIRNTIYPIIAKYHQNSMENLKKFVYQLSKYILVVSIPIIFLIYHFSNDIVSIIFTPEYTLSISMLKITIWTSLSYSLSILLYGLLIYQNEEKKVALALFISGLLTLVLDFVLAPRYGVLIIPLIRLLASYLQFGVLLYFHYRISKYGLLTKKNFFSLLFCFLVMLSVTILLNPINSVLAFIIGLLVYVICLIISGVLRNQDKTLVIKLGKEILGISNKIK